MALMTEYGQTIVVLTAELQRLVASAVSSVSSPVDGAPIIVSQITARSAFAARSGISGISANLFLYSDRFILTEQTPADGIAGAELRYLVTVYPADDAHPELAQLVHGIARTALSESAELTILLPSGVTRRIRLSTMSLSLADETSIWLASGSPERLSFVITATFLLTDDTEPVRVPSIDRVIALAQPGLIVVFSGPDVEGKAAAAASVADALGQSIVRVRPDRIVSKYIAETKQNLEHVLAAAEGHDWVLYFDEADALFGRLPGAGGYDRYAGVERPPVIDLLSSAPGVVIIPVREAGDDLLAKAALVLRFPPER